MKSAVRLYCGLFCWVTACDTADVEEKGLIILVLAPVFCLGPFGRKFPLMNILSSRGFSEVISGGYKGDERAISG
jgi:hypothetical protein